MRSRAVWATLAIVLVAAPLLAAAAVNNVRKVPTSIDAAAIDAILKKGGHSRLLKRRINGYAEEIAAIRSVQDAVLSVAPVNEGIPLDRPREPADLLIWQRGLCYDRSRTIELALQLLNIETRHVVVYATDRTGSAALSLMKPGVESHAVSEARTRHGWVAIDPNERWLSLDENGEPVPLARIDDHIADGRGWWSGLSAPPNAIFMKPYTYVYGLYSRHGRFFPPMNVVPDVNWVDALRNIAME